ncbi:MAG TPA: thioredoxin-disulfide reductase [Elusimicrobia bacterium]|nr:thioredoxin-disulfide reductase [Elusimicrobiota bacterium]
MYDLIIVGAGQAGITASIYAARKRMNFLVITKDLGGQTILSAKVENYTGYQFIPGTELVDKFREHLEQFKIELKEGERVTLVKKDKDILKIETEKGKYETKTAVVASGRIPRKLGVEGEDEFKNRGVTYCATCDAPLFADMEVAVIGGGKAALDAVLQLIKIARKVYLMDIAPQLRADPIMVEKTKKSEKVTIYNNTKVDKIYGDKFVRGMRISRQGKSEDLAVGGIFIEIGSLPATDFVPEVAKNEIGEIIVNCRCETNIPGLFAAGDVTNVPAKQIIVACGEGAKASLSAFEYLSKKK